MNSAEMLKGHLDGLLLAVLEGGPLHGYGVVEELRRRSEGVLDLPSGTIYPALHRLERTSLVSSDWSTHNGRRRRTYRLTRAGRRALAAHRDSWTSFTATVERVLAQPT
jgi:PadR family transcriptional regulator, regulatory protein PadR